jgi:hypothetical protein
MFSFHPRLGFRRSEMDFVKDLISLTDDSLMSYADEISAEIGVLQEEAHRVGRERNDREVIRQKELAMRPKTDEERALDQSVGSVEGGE